MPSLAKSSGITLQEHTQNVMKEAKTLLSKRPFCIQKYKEMTGLNLPEKLSIAAFYHDIGKKHSKTWQEACRKDYEAYQQWRLKNGLNPDEVYAEQYKLYERECYKKNISTGKALMKAGVRHEFASLDYIQRHSKPLDFIERVAIAAHHGKLGHRHQKRWEEDGRRDETDYLPFWNEFYSIQNKWQNSEPDLFRKSLLERFTIAGVRSLLQLADTRASRAEAGEKLASIESFEYQFPFCDKSGSPSYRGVQDVIVQHWDETELILRAPTGSGKTDASLLWGKHQIDTNRADRIVIAMPTRFTSNALATNVNQNVSDTGLYHSSAWYSKWQKVIEKDQIGKGDAKAIHNLARLLETPVTVSTIDHLLIALTGTREDHHHILFNLANSCVIIDEADFYDAFVQANIVLFLDVLRILKVPFLIMSATVPESAKALYNIHTPIVEDKSNLLDVRCHVIDEGQIEGLEGIEELLMRATTEPTIIYANTVDRALMYYDWFQANAKNTKCTLYHSRFTEPDKFNIEACLLEMLGKEAWKNGIACGVAIMTQIGEMSINISADFMISDLCPFDRLAQRAGRISRFRTFEETRGELHVITPIKKGELYPAPYGSFDLQTKHWFAGKPFKGTLEALRTKGYSASDFIQEVNRLYPEVSQFESHVENNAHNFEQHIKQNWLIVPKAESKQDADETNQWKSRDIAQQGIVFTQKPPTHFKSYTELNEFELECGVSMPLWEIQVGLALKRVHSINIQIGDDKPKNEKEESYRYYSGDYSRYEGLILKHKRDISTKEAMV